MQGRQQCKSRLSADRNFIPQYIGAQNAINDRILHKLSRNGRINNIELADHFGLSLWPVPQRPPAPRTGFGTARCRTAVR